MIDSRIKINEKVFLDGSANELIFADESEIKQVRIEPNMAKIISEIAQTPGTLATREQLISAVWNGDERVGNKALTKNIYKIRKVFEQHGLTNPIETISKKGYRLKAGLKNVHHSRAKKDKIFLIIGFILLGLVMIKFLFPGLWHMFYHRMMH